MHQIDALTAPIPLVGFIEPLDHGVALALEETEIEWHSLGNLVAIMDTIPQ
jgi:hypothetical protein